MNSFQLVSTELEQWMQSHSDIKWRYKPYRPTKPTLKKPTNKELAELSIEYDFQVSKDLRTLDNSKIFSLSEWLSKKARQFPYKPKKLPTLGKPKSLTAKDRVSIADSVEQWNKLTTDQRVEKLAVAKSNIRDSYYWV